LNNSFKNFKVNNFLADISIESKGKKLLNKIKNYQFFFLIKQNFKKILSNNNYNFIGNRLLFFPN